MSENEMKQIHIAESNSKHQYWTGRRQSREGFLSLLQKLTDKEPIRVESGDGAKSFGVREGLNVGAMVTLRGEEARKFLEKVLPAVDEISANAFDGQGNFSFRISQSTSMYPESTTMQTSA